MLQQPNINAAGTKQTQAAQGANGASSTIKTGPEGLEAPNLSQKTLLG